MQIELLKKRRPFFRTACVFFLILLFLFCGIGFFFLSATLPTLQESVRPSVPLVILDAGHGGEDGGAVGVNGAIEKELNLSIAFMLADMLRASGVEVILTRSEDKLLYTEEENIKGHRKEYDLKNRLKIAKEHPAALFVSIHMNTFPEEKYSGLQVYYAKGQEGSGELAHSIQRAVASGVQPQNTRKIKPADSSIYLLHGAPCRAVLIECGFLSNPEECALLSEKDYQRRLCFSIFCGMMNYINQEGR